MGQENQKGDPPKLALEHSRALFIYHAGQRILSLNYYFVAIAVFLTGLGFLATSSTITTSSRAVIGLVLSFAGIVLTKCFWGLDRRNEELVNCSKQLLKHVEGEMAKLDKCEEWRIMRSADDSASSYRYRSIVPTIFRLYIFLSVVGGIYAIWPWATRVLCCH